MNGQMERYRKLLETTPEPMLPSEMPKVRMDLSGLIRYAKARGVQPADLPDDEASRFFSDGVVTRFA